MREIQKLYKGNRPGEKEVVELHLAALGPPSM